MKTTCNLLLFSLLLFKTTFSQPLVTSVFPTSAAPGSTVIITGSNFNLTPSLNTVYFGATKGIVTSGTSSSLSVQVPYGANHFPVTVLNTSNGLLAFSQQALNTSFLCPGITATNVLSPRIDFLVSGANQFVEMGDLDGDGKSEMIAAVFGSGTGTVCVFRNTSSSGTLNLTSFAPFQSFTVPSPEAIALGDINGDGKLDIITASTSNHNVSILKNTSTLGAISFDPVQTLVMTSPGSLGPTGLSVDDLDMDGKADIVIAYYNAGKISILKNTSSTTVLSFAANVDFTSLPQTYRTAVADFDGDGKKDIAATNNSVVTVFKNTASPGSINLASFAPAVSFTCGAGLVGIGATDFDNDGKIDIAVSSIFSNSVFVLRNTTASATITPAAFAVPITFTAIGSAVSLLIGELNGDGKPDLISLGLSSTMFSILQNNSTPGNISFAPKVDFQSNNVNRTAALGDLDNDGRSDLLVGTVSSSLAVFRNLLGLNATTASTNATCYGANNGQIFLTASSLNSITVLWSNSATGFSLTNLSSGIYTYSLSTGTCALTQSVAISEPPPVVLTVTSSSSVSCSGQSVTLNVNGASSYSWSNGSAGTSITVAPTNTSTILVTGTNAIGCAGTATFIQNVSAPDVLVSSSNSLLCEGESSTLTATGVLNYTWSTGATTSSISVNPSVSATYTVFGLDTHGCSDTTFFSQSVVPCTNLSEGEVGALTLNIYPNPGNGHFKINVDNLSGNLNMLIYTSLGEKAAELEIDKKSVLFDLSYLSTGVYYYVCYENSKMKCFGKLIKY